MPPPDLWVLVPLAGMATGTLFLYGVYRLINRWLELRHGGRLPESAVDDIAELRGEITELRELPARVAELEERLDFAERLLARGRPDAGTGGH